MQHYLQFETFIFTGQLTHQKSETELTSKPNQTIFIHFILVCFSKITKRNTYWIYQCIKKKTNTCRNHFLGKNFLITVGFIKRWKNYHFPWKKEENKIINRDVGCQKKKKKRGCFSFPWSSSYGNFNSCGINSISWVILKKCSELITFF